MENGNGADISRCLARLNWAENALQELNGLARRHALLVDWDGERPKDTSAESMRASLLASNIVHQLRSALDNLVWQLAWLNRTDPGPRSSFPLRNKDNARTQEVIADKLMGLKPEHVDAIKLCQPYHEIEGHPLKELEDLWTTDKHDVLLLVEPSPDTLNITPDREVPGQSLVYEHGRGVVPTLGRALGAVDVIIRSFTPAFDEEPVNLDFTVEAVEARQQYFRSRDPHETYLDDLKFLFGVIPIVNRTQVPARVIQELLAAVERLLNDPIGYRFYRHRLLPLRERLREFQSDDSP